MICVLLAWLGQFLTVSVPIEPQLETPVDIVLRGEALFVVDYTGHACWALDARTGRTIQRYGQYGQGPGEIERPEKVWFSDGRLWLFSHDAKRIVVFDLATGAPLETIRVHAPGFAAGLWRDQLIMAGQSPGRFTPDGPVVALYPLVSSTGGRIVAYRSPGGSRQRAFGAPSQLAQKARGWLQQHLALWVPERSALFYGDPVDFGVLIRFDLSTGRTDSIALPVQDLAVWDGRRPIRQALPELDLYHGAGHVLTPTPRGDFLFITWRRAAGGFYTAVLDLTAKAPAGALADDRFPVGALDGRMIFWREADAFSLLRQPLAAVFLEASGRNPFAR